VPVTAWKISLQSGPRAESQFVFGPKTFVVKISDGATRPVARKSGFTAVGIEDATVEISLISFGFAYDRNAISAGPVMPVADASRKLAEALDAFQLLSFKDEIVVSQSVKFSELWLHLLRLTRE